MDTPHNSSESILKNPLQDLISIPTKHPVSLKARLTVMENVYFQRPGIDPTQYGSPSAVWLTTTEQEYRRDKLSTTTWRLIEQAQWIDKASMILIRNLEKRPGHHNLSQDQLEEMTRKTIEISFGSGGISDILISPGESCRFRPGNIKGVYLRSKGTPVRYEMVVFPE